MTFHKLILPLIIVGVIGASQSSQKPTIDKRVDVLELKVQELEKRIKALEAEITHPPPTVVTNKKSEKLAKLKLVKWSYSYTKGDYSSYYRISYELFNEYEKGVKLIDASLHFEDLLGEHLFGIKITPDLRILPGRKKSDSGNYRISSFDYNQQRMKDMVQKDVVPKLVVRRIVFEDNTILEF